MQRGELRQPIVLAHIQDVLDTVHDFPELVNEALVLLYEGERHFHLWAQRVIYIDGPARPVNPMEEVHETRLSTSLVGWQKIDPLRQMTTEADLPHEVVELHEVLLLLVYALEYHAHSMANVIMPTHTGIAYSTTEVAAAIADHVGGGLADLTSSVLPQLYGNLLCLTGRSYATADGRDVLPERPASA